MFAGQILVELKQCKQIHDSPDFWKDVSITAAGEIPNTYRYDTIIIDETQDFEEQDWLLVSELIEDSTRVFAFHDPDQRFWTERTLPAFVTQHFVKFPLEKQYRTPGQIWALAECYAASHQGSGMEDRLSLIRQGIAEKRIQFVTYQDEKVRDARIKKIIKNMKVEGF